VRWLVLQLRSAGGLWPQQHAAAAITRSALRLSSALLLVLQLVICIVLLVGALLECIIYVSRFL
jgi:hypothetical protein